ncbi:MAG: RluA family pseudouridine synthase [Thermanaerothrix sp.]|nr:RluA family pseudouridine synthase [Thermanaerothrix sp.]
MRKYMVPPEEEGRRLDRLIRDWWPSVGMGLRMGAIRRGNVRLDGRKVQCSERLVSGQELTVPWDDEPVGRSSEASCGDGDVSGGLPSWVLYMDRVLLVANKPPGWICQPGGRGGGKSLPEEVWRLIGRTGPVPAHRLDVNTSGLVLVPLAKVFARELHRMFRESLILKVYWAVVKGRCGGPLRIDAPLHDPHGGPVVVSGEGRDALSMVRPICTSGGYSLVEVKLVTGRKHQARVHLAHAGLPIVGDPVYGVKLKDVKRPMLHCRFMALPEEASLGNLKGASFTAPLMEDMESLMRALGLWSSSSLDRCDDLA